MSKTLRFVMLFGMLALLNPGGIALADGTFPDLDSFDVDDDGRLGGGSWTPDDDPFYVPTDDPTFDGTTPAGWSEFRDPPVLTSGTGVIEEVTSGFAGVTANKGDGFAAVYFDDGDGPYGRKSRYWQQPDPPATPVAWSYRTDIYTSPEYGPSGVPNLGTRGSNGIPDFWWTNGLNLKDGDSYLTETGMTAEILDDGVEKVWSFTTTAGGYSTYEAPLETWFTMEVRYFDNRWYRTDGLGDGKVGAMHILWNADHSQVLWTTRFDHMFLDPEWTDVGGPRYSWFTFGESNLPRILVDETGADQPVGFGDMNADGFTDNFDIEPFEIALTDPEGYLIAYSNALLYDMRGDINFDGSFDNFDIESFELFLTGGLGPSASAAVPEPSSVALLGCWSTGPIGNEPSAPALSRVEG